MSKKTKKQQSPKKETTQATQPIPKSQAKDVFAKLVANASSYDNAWALVRKAFPRKEWGRVREITQKLSAYKTLRAAFNSLHGSSKKGAKRGAAKSELQSRAA